MVGEIIVSNSTILNFVGGIHVTVATFVGCVLFLMAVYQLNSPFICSHSSASDNTCTFSTSAVSQVTSTGTGMNLDLCRRLVIVGLYYFAQYE
jgi:hypothetical protein